MKLAIHSSFLPHLDADASLHFYRDLLGFEVRLDVGYDDLRWITLGAPGQGDTNLVLQPPVSDPGVLPSEAQLIEAMMAKGTYAGINLACDDLDALFEGLERAGVEIVQEPKSQDYGVRDCAVRDPAGNLIRIQQMEN